MERDWTRAMVLSMVELDVCWEALGLGETPWQLQLPSPGTSHLQRREIAAGALRALCNRGLATQAGVGPRLRGALALLARPQRQVDLHVREESLWVAVGAMSGRRGVLAVRHREQVGLLSVQAAAVPAALVDLHGAIRPGVGHPVTVPADTFDAAREVAGDRGVWKLADALAARGVPAPEARSLARMCSGVEQIAQLGATVATTRSPWVVGLHRSSVGHYVQLRRPGPDGLVRVSIEPVSRPRLVRLLEELLAVTASRAAA